MQDLVHKDEAEAVSILPKAYVQENISVGSLAPINQTVHMHCKRKPHPKNSHLQKYLQFTRASASQTIARGTPGESVKLDHIEILRRLKRSDPATSVVARLSLCWAKL